MIKRHFNPDQFKYEIESIHKLNNYVKQEIFYRKIGVKILSELEGKKQVKEANSKMKGVPFDIIFKHNDEIGLVELKGSKNFFNKPDNVQFARLKIIIDALSKGNYQVKPYLLQINLSKSVYRLHDRDDLLIWMKTDDPNLGLKTPIIKILEYFEIFMKTMMNPSDKSI